MKNKLKWIIKLLITLGLFTLIFTELGERYVPMDRSVLNNGDAMFFKRGKRFLGALRGQPEAFPATVEDLCSLDNRHAYLVKDPAKDGGFLAVDRDVHCVEGGLTRVFVKRGDTFMEVELADTADQVVYLKSKGWWRVAPITPKDLWNEIRNLDMSVFWFWILFATVMKTGGIFASLGRWTVLLRGQKIRLPFRYLAGTFFVGRFFGMFLPSTLGLDGYRLYDSIRQTRRPVECTAVIAVEKLIGFIALFGLVFVTLPLGTRILDIQKPVLLYGILAFLAIFITFVLLLLFWPRLATTIFDLAPFPMKKRFQGKIDEVVKATTAYSDKKLLLLQAILLGFLVHIGTILMYFGTMRSIIATNVDIYDIFFASPLMITGTVFGPTIGGEGIRELVFTLLLGPQTGAAKAFMLGHLGFWIGEFLLSMPGALVYILRPANYRPLKREDLEAVRRRN
ncbi:flippase-like domain-containing protein [bacterium]|nr:flippase-like domain-containing protein [candidate division CSSED10-310 bacterium]